MSDFAEEVKSEGLSFYEAERARITIEGAPNRGDAGWFQYRFCTRKVRYEEDPPVINGWIRAYRCNFCEGYHYTSQPRTGQKKEVDKARDAAKIALPSRK